MENEITVIAAYSLVKIGLIAFLAMYAYNNLVGKLEPQRIRKTQDPAEGVERRSQF